MHRGLGWLPELPDKRDFPITKLARIDQASVNWQDVDFRDKFSPIRDQGNIGSCVGFSVAAIAEFYRRNDPDLYSTIYSPLFVYYMARAARGWERYDVGCYIRDAIKVAANVGVAQESAWKYREDRFARHPSDTALKQASRWQLGTYARCRDAHEVMAALVAGYPVIGGFTCYSNLFNEQTNRTGIIQLPGVNDYVIGGHAVVFCGCDASNGYMIFRNSWGKGWGDNGYGYLPFGYMLAENLTDDFWAVSGESEASFIGKAP